MRVHINTSSVLGSSLDAIAAERFHPDVLPEVRRFLKHIPYQETRLHALPKLAHSLGIAALLVKDEGLRSSLGSFKALGGTHAVIRLVIAEASKQLGRSISPEDLHVPAVRAVSAKMTFACATDGNHGRAVAAGARICGARSCIFVHSGVSGARVAAIEAEGASVTRVAGNYDDSLVEVNRAASALGWQVVSDTSWPGYEEIPSRVMQGYLVMAEEAITQAAKIGTLPTHVFLQAGVGGYAAAVAAFLSLRLASDAPRIVVVEPERAACLFESASKDAPIRIPAQEPTVMAMLECYEPSHLAWRVLQRTANAFVTISDSSAIEAMRVLAHPAQTDPPIVSGESGGAGLAGLIEASKSREAREALGINENSAVLIFNTEGATDAAVYQRLVAREGVI